MVIHRQAIDNPLNDKTLQVGWWVTTMGCMLLSAAYIQAYKLSFIYICKPLIHFNGFCYSKTHKKNSKLYNLVTKIAMIFLVFFLISNAHKSIFGIFPFYIDLLLMITKKYLYINVQKGCVFVFIS